VRRIAFVHVQNYIPADIAIVKVDLPFVLQQTLQGVTLAPIGFIPPGIERFFQFSITNNFEVKEKI